MSEQGFNTKLLHGVADNNPYGADIVVHSSSKYINGNSDAISGILTWSGKFQWDERYPGRELPHKFKFGVTGCQNNCLKAEENDVGIKGGTIVEWKESACINCGLCARCVVKMRLRMQQSSFLKKTRIQAKDLTLRSIV